jgi:nicotinamide-nucleotide amidase
MIEPLLEQAGRVAAQLKARGQTIAVGESAAGGLITAALLAVPGASAYCRGGLVVYTRNALVSLRSIDVAKLDTMRAATEAYARFEAQTLRSHFETDWGLGETGAAGPTGNKYGDPAGHVCVAVAGPGLGTSPSEVGERSRTIRTGSADRLGNMQAFAAAALLLMAETLEELAPPH